jgi:hypothetical protein
MSWFLFLFHFFVALGWLINDAVSIKTINGWRNKSCFKVNITWYIKDINARHGIKLSALPISNSHSQSFNRIKHNRIKQQMNTSLPSLWSLWLHVQQ